MKFIRIILFSFVIILLFAACNTSETEVETPVPQVETPKLTITDTIAPTRTETQTPTVSETSTSSATSTATTKPNSDETPTPSPTKIVVFVIDTDMLALRAGPGIYYELLDFYPEGTEVILLETEPARKWFWVQVVEDGEEGWMFAKFLSIDPGSLEFIPVVDATPTPKPIDTTPNLTATQECEWLEDKGTPCP